MPLRQAQVYKSGFSDKLDSYLGRIILRADLF